MVVSETKTTIFTSMSEGRSCNGILQFYSRCCFSWQWLLSSISKPLAKCVKDRRGHTSVSLLLERKPCTLDFDHQFLLGRLWALVITTALRAFSSRSSGKNSCLNKRERLIKIKRIHTSQKKFAGLKCQKSDNHCPRVAIKTAWKLAVLVFVTTIAFSVVFTVLEGQNGAKNYIKVPKKIGSCL